MEQQLISSEENTTENPVENSTPVVEEKSNNEVTEKSSDTAKEPVENLEVTTNKAEENSKNYQLRKQQEVENYRRQLAEKDRKIQELSRQKPREGEEFDPLLGVNIPKNLSAAEYRELLALKHKQDVEVKIANTVKNEIDNVQSKNTDAYTIFQTAFENGLINENMVLAAVNKKDGANFLYSLLKENPKVVQEIASIRNAYEQAAAFGELFATYKNRPASRKSSIDVPPSVLKETGGKSSVEDNIAKKYNFYKY